MISIFLILFVSFSSLCANAEPDPIKQLVGRWSLPNGTLEIKLNHEFFFSGGNSEVPGSYYGDIKWQNANRFRIFTYGWSIECDLVFEKTTQEYVVKNVGSGPVSCSKIFSGNMRKIDSGAPSSANRPAGRGSNQINQSSGTAR